MIGIQRVYALRAYKLPINYEYLYAIFQCKYEYGEYTETHTGNICNCFQQYVFAHMNIQWPLPSVVISRKVTEDRETERTGEGRL